MEACRQPLCRGAAAGRGHGQVEPGFRSGVAHHGFGVQRLESVGGDVKLEGPCVVYRDSELSLVTCVRLEIRPGGCAPNGDMSPGNPRPTGIVNKSADGELRGGQNCRPAQEQRLEEKSDNRAKALHKTTEPAEMETGSGLDSVLNPFRR
jgi:hypothetical protein